MVVVTLCVYCNMSAIKQEWSKSEMKIVESAQQLIWKFGIRKVTVEEICEIAQVSKMTFYRSFNNKISVVEIILKKLFNDGMKSYESIMSSDISFPDKIEQIFEMKKKSAHDMSEMFIHDLMHIEDKNLLGLMIKFQKESGERFIQDLKDAQVDGWIRKGIKIDFINYMINLIQDQLKNDEFLLIFENMEEANEQIKNFLFFGVINEKKEK